MSSYICLTPYNMDFPVDTNHKEPACQETQSVPWVPSLGQGDLLEEGMATHSSMNPMDRGAWRATVHVVAKSTTWLSD